MRGSPTTRPARPGWTRWLFIAMLAVHTAAAAWSALIHSPNANEAAHLIAGVSHWELGRFELYRVNPPLVRMVAAAPAVWMGCETDWSLFSEAPGARSAFSMVPGYIAANGKRSYRYIMWGRLMCIPFSWLGAWACYRWAQDLYGPVCGLLAGALWCFEPNVLAHASFMTPDGVATAVGIAAGYAFWRWLRQLTWKTAAIAGLLLGVTLLTKLTWIILFLIWPALATICAVIRRRRDEPMKPGLVCGQLGLMLVIGLDVLNMGYLYDGSCTRLGDFEFVSQALAGGTEEANSRRWGNRFESTVLGRIPLPFPAQYVLGFDVQKEDFESGRRTYLRGRWYDHGLWYYYLYALAVKVPVGVFVIGMAALCSLTAFSMRPMEWIVPAQFVIILGIVSSETSWNAHLRYALPALPFALIWISRAGLLLSADRKSASAVVLGGLLWFVASSLWYVPHSLSYFNELAGGPAAGHRHLVDSNVDWGQDLFLLKDWLDEHPEVGQIGLVYFGQFNPRAMGIDFFLPEEDPAVRRPPGWYAVSATMMHGMEFWQTAPDGQQHWCERDGFVDFQSRAPVDRVGYSIFIFHIE